MELRYNLRRDGKLFRGLPKDKLLQLARARLLLPDDELTDLSSGRETTPIQEFAGWFSDTSKPLVSSVDVLEDFLESGGDNGGSSQHLSANRKKEFEALRDLFQPIMNELREIRAETEKTKSATRVIAVLLFLIVLFGFKIVVH